MPFSFYVYYRVADGSHAVAMERVGVLQRRLRRETGSGGRLLKKRGEPDLWMEVYDRVPDAAAFELILDEVARDTAFDEVLSTGWSRRVECFED